MVKQYFFNTNMKADWREGGKITFEGVHEGKTYKDKGTVKEIKPYNHIKYNYWGSMSGIEDKPENYADITYTLHEKDDQTTLTITQENIPDEKMRVHSETNWKKVLVNLKNLLEKQAVSSL